MPLGRLNLLQKVLLAEQSQLCLKLRRLKLWILVTLRHRNCCDASMHVPFFFLFSYVLEEEGASWFFLYFLFLMLELQFHPQEAAGKVKSKAEKKVAPTQVAFGFGGASTPLKSYGSPKGGIGNRHGGPASGGGVASSSGLRVEKEYKEPWDYYSYYPATLPLRRPYSGNPELLDEEEFCEASESMDYDENSTNPGVELGLMEENLEASMLFLQLPATMPMIKQSDNKEVQGMASSSKPSKRRGPSEDACGLADLPAGYMGKMLVYSSGAVKLKLGDTIYDVSAGLDCVFAQDVAAINVEEKHCCIVGELSKRAIITPDVDSILDTRSDLL